MFDLDNWLLRSATQPRYPSPTCFARTGNPAKLVEHLPAGYLDEQGYLLAETERKLQGDIVSVAVRDTKGMSVCLSIEGLPAFRKPLKFGGVGKDPLWQIDRSKIVGDLQAVQDNSIHVSILPRVTMSLSRYEAALTSTKNDWERAD